MKINGNGNDGYVVNDCDLDQGRYELCLEVIENIKSCCYIGVIPADLKYLTMEYYDEGVY
jgi:hypothetical protein